MPSKKIKFGIPWVFTKKHHHLIHFHFTKIPQTFIQMLLDINKIQRMEEQTHISRKKQNV